MEPELCAKASGFAQAKDDAAAKENEMTDQELQQSFDYCKQANDPEQWDLLAIAYYMCGYDMNALHCFKQADACRVLVQS